MKGKFREKIEGSTYTDWEPVDDLPEGFNDEVSVTIDGAISKEYVLLLLEEVIENAPTIFNDSEGI